MQVTKCDRCGKLYDPNKPTNMIDSGIMREPPRFPMCSRFCLTDKNTTYDLCEKCTEEILASFKGE